MRLVTIRLWVTILATCVGVAFVVLLDLLTTYTSILLGIEVLLLPSIYIVGNTLAEQKIQEEYAATIEVMTQQVNQLNDKYYKERNRYTALKARFEKEMLQ